MILTHRANKIICIPKSPHKTLAERSRQKGVSMNQFYLYLLSGGVNAVYNTKNE